MKPALIYDSVYLEHNTGIHPECKERLVSIIKETKSINKKIEIEKPLKATISQINLVHPLSHIYKVKEYSMLSSPLDSDTPTSKNSFDVALWAAGAGIKAMDLITSKKAKFIFCAIRPPGHHATISQSMGFCLFNNIAITARFAQSIGFEKILIVDFDVHHGNGTQEIFYHDNTVFYFSTHQAFAYPGTGSESETGEGKGKGFTANFRLMPNSTDKEILPIYENELKKIYDMFKPSLILVSAGYDLHESDPLAMLDVSYDGIRKIVKNILLCGNIPKIFFLEGGYDLEALGKNVKNTLLEMADAL